MPTKLTETECRAAMSAGEFPEEIRNATPAVAIILTQSWCPQWRFLSTYIKEAEANHPGELTIRYLEYDREPFFEEFMDFKESTFRNYEVPYVRYYRSGTLVAETNFISLQGFLDRLGLGSKPSEKKVAEERL